MVSVGSIITGGFRLFREQPVAVAVWGVLYGCMTAGSTLWLGSIMQSHMAAVETGQDSAVGFLRWMLPVYGLMALAGLIMSAAAFRAVMRPASSAAAFLRIGGDELRLFVLALFWLALNLVLYVILVVVVGLVAGIVGGASGSGAAAAVVGVLIALPMIGLMVFFHIRLSPAIPLTLLRRKIIIGEAWRLTRGNFWTLFAGYLVIVLILIVGYLIAASVAMGSLWSALAAGGLNAQSIDAVNDARFAQMTTITPMTVLSWAISAAFGASAYALWAGSVGTATHELLGTNATDYAATFE